MKQEPVTAGKERKRPMKVYSAKEKSQAVLSLWSGRRSAASLMKELGVAWGLLNHWEKRALTGMLTALDPTWKQPEAEGVRLPARVERLMNQTLSPAVEPAAPK
jgi:transposase-like protein